MVSPPIQDAQIIVSIPRGWQVAFVRWRSNGLYALATHPDFAPKMHLLTGKRMKPFAAWLEVQELEAA